MAEKRLAICFVFSYVAAAFGQSVQVEADLLLQRAEKTAVYSSTEASFPYHERVTFTLSSTPGKMKGRFLKDYLSHELWRERYELGEYLRVGVRNGKQMGEFRSDAFQPIVLDRVRNTLLPVAIRVKDGDKVGKIKNATVNGMKARCIEYQTTHGSTHEEDEICLNLIDGTPLRRRQHKTLNISISKIGLVETEWSDYTSFRDKHYPRHIVVKCGDARIIEAEVGFTGGTDLVPATFSIPSNFESRRACDQVSPPKRIQGRVPDNPSGNGKVVFVGGMLVQARIGVDGKVQDAQGIWNPAYATQPGPAPPLAGKGMTKAVTDEQKPFVDAVKQWTFELATCDGVPIVENILIPFNADFLF